MHLYIQYGEGDGIIFRGFDSASICIFRSADVFNGASFLVCFVWPDMNTACVHELTQCIRRLFSRLTWVPQINPMHLYLSGLSYNEFSGNINASGSSDTFEYLQDEYGFHVSRSRAVIRLLLMAIMYRVIWLLLLKLREIANEKRRLRRAMGAAKRRAKKIVSAGLRWRKSRDGYHVSTRNESVIGVGLINVGGDDDYSMMSTLHGSRSPVFSTKMTSPNGGDPRGAPGDRSTSVVSSRNSSSYSSDSNRGSIYTARFSGLRGLTTPEGNSRTSAVDEDSLRV